MPQIKLNAQHFESMITRRGVRVKWEKANRCTCWDDHGQPLYSCKACKGTGFVYDAPIESSNILVMGLAYSKEFTQIGEFRLGDCVATIPKHYKYVDANGRVSYPENPLYEIGEWDKITLLDTEFRSHEVLIKDIGMYGREPNTLRNPEVIKILTVLSSDYETGEVTFYKENIDFKVNGNKIEWLINLPEGTKYSVTYSHRPIYIVYSQLPQNRDPDGQHFPKKVILRYQDVI